MEKHDSNEPNSVKRNKKRKSSDQIYSKDQKRKQRRAKEWPEGLDDEADRTGPPAQRIESGHIRKTKKGKKKNHRNRRAKELAAKNKNKDDPVDSVNLEDEIDARFEKAATGTSDKHDDNGTGDCSNQI